MTRLQLFGFVLALHFKFITGQKQVTDLFNVDQTTCAQYLTVPQGGGNTRLQTLSDEAADMALAGLQMFDSAQNSLYANAYLVGLLRTTQNTRSTMATIQGERSARKQRAPVSLAGESASFQC
jgi:hypothetical protein